MIASMLRAVVFFCMIAAAFASATLDVLVNAAASFLGYDPATTRNAKTIRLPAELAEKTFDYATAGVQRVDGRSSRVEA
jgi:hypothetical protein